MSTCVHFVHLSTHTDYGVPIPTQGWQWGVRTISTALHVAMGIVLYETEIAKARDLASVYIYYLTLVSQCE